VGINENMSERKQENRLLLILSVLLFLSGVLLPEFIGFSVLVFPR